MLLLLLFLAYPSRLLAQDSVELVGTEGRPLIDLELLPSSVRDTLKTLSMKNVDLRDVFRGIAHEHNLNLFVDNSIEKKITIRLSNLPVIEVLSFLCQQNGLFLTQQGGIFRIETAPEPLSSPVPKPSIEIAAGLLTADLQGEELADIIRAIVEADEINIVIRRGVSGPVSGMLKKVPLIAGLKTLLANNGFSLREREGIYHIDRTGMEGGGNGKTGAAFWVQVDEGLVTLDVVDATIAHVIREIGIQSKTNLITYQLPEGNITAKFNGLSIQESFNYLFKGTPVTYREQGGVFVIGNKETSGIASTKLLRLDHLRADALLELIPEPLKENTIIQVVKEHNGIMVMGTNDLILEVENFVSEVDHPTPQILIEALVVDFTDTDLFSLGVEFGLNEELATAQAGGAYQFGDGGLTVAGDGAALSDVLSPLGNMFGLKGIGKLPADFYFRIDALSAEGKAHIRSRPQISALNGHPASISIGTTQYFILEANTPYPATRDVYVQSSQRFESIEANVKLEVIPWVSASGEVTAEIHPEFSTPVGNFDPEVPPTINSRVLDSTVRLKDGETIILGGLITDEQVVNYNKVPFFGSIPLLGHLFRSRSHDTRKTELVIFITPHVFYGDEEEADKWNDLRSEFGFSSEALNIHGSVEGRE